MHSADVTPITVVVFGFAVLRIGGVEDWRFSRRTLTAADEGVLIGQRVPIFLASNADTFANASCLDQARVSRPSHPVRRT